MNLVTKSILTALSLAISATSFAGESVDAAPVKAERNKTTFMVGRTGFSSNDDPTVEGDGFAIGVSKELNKVVSGSFRYSRSSFTALGASGEIGTFGLYPEVGYRLDLNESLSIKPYAMIGLEYNLVGIADTWSARNFSTLSFSMGIGVRAEIADKVTVSFDVKSADLEIAEDYYVNSTVSMLMVGVKF